MDNSVDHDELLSLKELVSFDHDKPFEAHYTAHRKLREALAIIVKMPDDRSKTELALTCAINFIRSQRDMRGLEAPLIPLLYALHQADAGIQHPLTNCHGDGFLTDEPAAPATVQ